MSLDGCSRSQGPCVLQRVARVACLMPGCVQRRGLSHLPRTTSVSSLLQLSRYQNSVSPPHTYPPQTWLHLFGSMSPNPRTTILLAQPSLFCLSSSFCIEVPLNTHVPLLSPRQALFSRRSLWDSLPHPRPPKFLCSCHGRLPQTQTSRCPSVIRCHGPPAGIRVLPDLHPFKSSPISPAARAGCSQEIHPGPHVRQSVGVCSHGGSEHSMLLSFRMLSSEHQKERLPPNSAGASDP